MTPALTAAAERLVSLPGFRWMPGMLVANDKNQSRFQFLETEKIGRFVAQPAWFRRCGLSEVLPDLTDPATLGCVLAMVREAWEDPGFSVSGHYQDDTGKYTFTANGGCIFSWGPNVDFRTHCDTEAECLVNALAAAAGAQ